MMMLFVLLLLSALLLLGPRPGTLPRLAGRHFTAEEQAHGLLPEEMGSSEPRSTLLRLGNLLGGRGRRDTEDLEAMAALVQHLGALLSSGRGPAQAWRELLDFQRTRQGADTSMRSGSAGGVVDLPLLVVAAQAATVGESSAQAIQRYLAGGRSTRVPPSAARQWERLASCLRASELSGCPLAALLARFAADLEHSSDAEGARQTALAGPKASVRLLGWLPFLGLGLGLLLGVDPIDIVFGSPIGGLVVVAGLAFWFLGRVWSRRLVSHAESGPR